MHNNENKNDLAADQTRTPEQTLALWRQARFGMFIHWGIYSATEGYWNGKETSGICEWIQLRERIPLSDYSQYAEKLTMEKFDAEFITELAKEAGMKYIVPTTKHHDGFAMYGSKVSDYNIVKMGASHRDPFEEISAAARRNGMLLGAYYSQAHDWEDPNGYGNNWDYNPDEKEFNKYFEGKCKGQVKEILTGYGDIDLIWFDVPQGITVEQSKDLKRFVQKLQPGCLVSGRISRQVGIGDYGSLGDNQIPAGKMEGDWETPVTLNDTWGYKSGDSNWKSPDAVIHILVRLMSKGVNCLLNIGPKANGEVPEESVGILKNVGRWMSVNGEAVYKTSASPFPAAFDWGYASAKENVIYLYVVKWRDKIEIGGLRNKVEKAYILGRPKEPLAIDDFHDISADMHTLCVHLPASPPCEYINVIRLELCGNPDIIQNIIQQPDGGIRLPAYLSDISGESVHTATAKKHSDAAVEAENHSAVSDAPICVDSAGVVSNWFVAEGSLRWVFKVYRPGGFKVKLLTLSKKYKKWVGGHKVRVECDGKVISAVLYKNEKQLNSGGFDCYEEAESLIGRVYLPSAGNYEITLFADEINAADEAGLAVSELTLTPDGAKLR
ncbi:MAG: alpha-L-fucosidase [Firmicutes bacterium]|nr:alpha-L-fucosidase [Bacillota bacterium]